MIAHKPKVIEWLTNCAIRVEADGWVWENEFDSTEDALLFAQELPTFGADGYGELSNGKYFVMMIIRKAG